MPFSEVRCSRFRIVLLYATDALFTLVTLSLPLLWLIGRFRFETENLRVSISWGLRPFVALAILLLLRLGLARLRVHPPLPGLLGRRRMKKVLLALFVFVALLPLTDALLAARGLARHPQPIVIAGDDDWDGQNEFFEHDPKLLWKFKAGSSVHGQPINQLGFPEREIAAAKPEGTRRVICMGDSCSAEGRARFPS
jgi:hypothetical protein